MAQLAMRQQGNLRYAQLRRQGMSEGMIQRWVAHRRLIPVHHGVYALGRPPRTPVERAAAAVLACGESAALAGAPALATWELGPWPQRMEIIDRRRHRHPGIWSHQSRCLRPEEVRWRQGMAVVSPALALLQCAPRLAQSTLTRTVNDALRRRIVSRTQLSDVLGNHPTASGARRLRRLLDGPSGPTRSQLEDSFLELCRRYGLPRPQINVVVAGSERDAFFPAERVIVELDGWQWHGDRRSFEHDRERDAAALEAGLPTVRITWERMHSDPRREAERLGRILAARREASRAA